MLRTDGRFHIRTDNMKTVYPPQTKFAGGIKKFGGHNMTLLYPNLCYNETCSKGTALSVSGELWVKVQILQNPELLKFKS